MEEQSSLRFYYSGYEKCSAGHCFGPAARVHYLIHLVISGKGLYQIGTVGAERLVQSVFFVF